MYPLCLKDKLDKFFFNLTGKKPWSCGYNAYKWENIKDALEKNLFSNGNFEAGYGYRIDERIIEIPWLFSRLPEHPGVFLDAGSAMNYSTILKQPKMMNKKLFISTLSPEKNCYWNHGISYVFEDLRDSCYRDKFFDGIICISTIEHVGLDNTLLYTSDQSKKENNRRSYLESIKEFNRILKPEGVLFITFPFGRYKDHGWFQVFDSIMLDELVKKFQPTLVHISFFRYTSTGWEKSSEDELADATFFDIHSQNNYDPDYAAGARGVACIEMKK